MQEISRALAFSSATEEYADAWLNDAVTDFKPLGDHITKMCSAAYTAYGKRVVLMIDEVDKTSSNRVFLYFLGMLRDKFLSRKAGKDHTFQSVILAGVTDIKNLKLKMINDGIYTPKETEGKIYNSPWNIAVDFDVDMAFSPSEIATMLNDYEADHKTGMDIGLVSEEIYKYTSGYPYLVSRICQYIDEKLDKDWTENGVQEAVKIITQEKSVLFSDMFKNLENNKELYDFIYAILIVGEQKLYVPDNPIIELAGMYGYIKKGNGGSGAGSSGYAIVANKTFEMRMSYYFSSKDENISRIESMFSRGLYQEVVNGDVFDMALCMRRFAEHYRELYAEADDSFLERHGRLLFLSWLKPLVNGQGFYHIESQFTDMRRMDVVVDFGSDQFIVEMKLWKGATAQERAYDQLLGYMDTKNLDKGYLLTFDFRKEQNRAYKAEWVDVGGKQVYEVIV
ncbi:MAG: GxxExxY protein, partial [Clostridiales bacterium]|nr:GxxExxY protein [Clostridiales bacterium]